MADGQTPFDATTFEFREEPVALSVNWLGRAGQARCSGVHAGTVYFSEERIERHTLVCLWRHIMVCLPMHSSK
jgi:hypothetical protein